MSLIVMEPGSEWPGHVGYSENVVVAGHDERGLRSRTGETLVALRRRGKGVRVAVLACTDATDSVWLASRAELAQELLAAVSSACFGRLLLTAGERATIPLRRELLSLAGALSQRLRDASATLSVRFGPTGLQDCRPAPFGLARTRPAASSFSRPTSPSATSRSK